MVTICSRGHENHFVTVKVVKHWHRSHKEFCGVSTLGDIQNLTGHGSEQSILTDPAQAEEWIKHFPVLPTSINHSLFLLLIPRSPEGVYCKYMSFLLAVLSHLNSRIPLY